MDRARSMVMAILSAASAAVLTGGCGSDPVRLGTATEVIWWTDHETGDGADWGAINPLAGMFWMLTGETKVAAGPAHSGRYALQSTITTRGKGNGVSAAVAQKHGFLPAEAYYSAWFYVPAPAPLPDEYWMIFKLRSRTVPADPLTEVEVWDVGIGARSDGKLGLALWDHRNVTHTSYDAGPAVPLERWFHLEAFLRASPAPDGRLELWLDGRSILLPIDGITMPSAFVEWAVGGVSEELAPATATILVDDAAISTRRLGPTAPFWRGL